ncbi:hypothetical protein ABPG72_017209 [Tetrahymena utriculariae]
MSNNSSFQIPSHISFQNQSQNPDSESQTCQYHNEGGLNLHQYHFEFLEVQKKNEAQKNQSAINFNENQIQSFQNSYNQQNAQFQNPNHQNMQEQLQNQVNNNAFVAYQHNNYEQQGAFLSNDYQNFQNIQNHQQNQQNQNIQFAQYQQQLYWQQQQQQQQLWQQMYQQKQNNFQNQQNQQNSYQIQNNSNNNNNNNQQVRTEIYITRENIDYIQNQQCQQQNNNNFINSQGINNQQFPIYNNCQQNYLNQQDNPSNQIQDQLLNDQTYNKYQNTDNSQYYANPQQNQINQFNSSNQPNINQSYQQIDQLTQSQLKAQSYPQQNNYSINSTQIINDHLQNSQNLQNNYQERSVNNQIENQQFYNEAQNQQQNTDSSQFYTNPQYNQSSQFKSSNQQNLNQSQSSINYQAENLLEVQQYPQKSYYNHNSILGINNQCAEKKYEQNSLNKNHSVNNQLENQQFNNETQNQQQNINNSLYYENTSKNQSNQFNNSNQQSINQSQQQNNQQIQSQLDNNQLQQFKQNDNFLNNSMKQRHTNSQIIVSNFQNCSQQLANNNNQHLQMNQQNQNQYEVQYQNLSCQYQQNLLNNNQSQFQQQDNQNQFQSQSQPQSDQQQPLYINQSKIYSETQQGEQDNIRSSNNNPIYCDDLQEFNKQEFQNITSGIQVQQNNEDNQEQINLQNLNQQNQKQYQQGQQDILYQFYFSQFQEFYEIQYGKIDNKKKIKIEAKQFQPNEINFLFLSALHEFTSQNFDYSKYYKKNENQIVKPPQTLQYYAVDQFLHNPIKQAQLKDIYEKNQDSFNYILDLRRGDHSFFRTTMTSFIFCLLNEEYNEEDYEQDTLIQQTFVKFYYTKCSDIKTIEKQFNGLDLNQNNNYKNYFLNCLLYLIAHKFSDYSDSYITSELLKMCFKDQAFDFSMICFGISLCNLEMFNLISDEYYSQFIDNSFVQIDCYDFEMNEIQSQALVQSLQVDIKIFKLTIDEKNKQKFKVTQELMIPGQKEILFNIKMIQHDNIYKLIFDEIEVETFKYIKDKSLNVDLLNQNTKEKTNQQEMILCIQCEKKLEFEQDMHIVRDEVTKQQFYFCMEHIYQISSSKFSFNDQTKYSFYLLGNKDDQLNIVVDKVKILSLLDYIIINKFSNIKTQCYFCKNMDQIQLIKLVTSSQILQTVICLSCASKLIKEENDLIITRDLFKNFISRESQISDNCQCCQKNIKKIQYNFNIDDNYFKLNLCEECLKQPQIKLEKLNIQVINNYFQQYQKDNTPQKSEQKINKDNSSLQQYYQIQNNQVLNKEEIKHHLQTINTEQNKKVIQQTSQLKLNEVPIQTQITKVGEIMDLSFISSNSSGGEKQNIYLNRSFSICNIDEVLYLKDQSEKKKIQQNEDYILKNKQEMSSQNQSALNESARENIDYIGYILNIKEQMLIKDASENNQSYQQNNKITNQQVLQCNINFKNNQQYPQVEIKNNSNNNDRIQLKSSCSEFIAQSNNQYQNIKPDTSNSKHSFIEIINEQLNNKKQDNQQQKQEQIEQPCKNQKFQNNSQQGQSLLLVNKECQLLNENEYIQVQNQTYQYQQSKINTYFQDINEFDQDNIKNLCQNDFQSYDQQQLQQNNCQTEGNNDTLEATLNELQTQNIDSNIGSQSNNLDQQYPSIEQDFQKFQNQEKIQQLLQLRRLKPIKKFKLQIS